jgi:GxxExxY protein
MTGGTARAGLALVHGELTRAIIGAFFEVYNELGYGFVESVYQRALPLALAARGVRSEREVPLSVRFRGEVVGDYRADLVVEGKVIVESKVADRILPVHPWSSGFDPPESVVLLYNPASFPCQHARHSTIVR